MRKTVNRTVKGSKAPKNYTLEERAKAVMLYRTNKNISLTATKFGISRPTLMKWLKEFPDIEAVDPATSAACVRAIEDASAIRLAFLREHYDNMSTVIRKGIKRADQLIENADNLGSVVNAIERLSTIIKDFTPAEDVNPTSTTINLLQQTLNNNS